MAMETGTLVPVVESARETAVSNDVQRSKYILTLEKISKDARWFTKNGG